MVVCSMIALASAAGAERTGPSEVVRWNDLALAAIQHGDQVDTMPTVASRRLFILHHAMFEAWAAYSDHAAGPVLGDLLRRPPEERTEANASAAVAHAAYRVLTRQYEEFEQRTGAFARMMDRLGLDTAASFDPRLPAGVGQAAALAVLDDREDDGSEEAHRFAEPNDDDRYQPRNTMFDLGSGGELNDCDHWQPLRVPTGRRLERRDDHRDHDPVAAVDDVFSFREQFFITPHWGRVRPFALADGAEHRPPPPPSWARGDEPYLTADGRHTTHRAEHLAQIDELIAFQADLDDRGKVIAGHFTDDHGVTPAGYWNILAQGISSRDGHGLAEDIRLFYVLNAAQFDAGVATWDAKRAHDFVRPVCAIRHHFRGRMISAWGGPQRFVLPIDASEWRPYQPLDLVTPPHPEYPSGHSAFAAAAAAAIIAAVGSDRLYDGKAAFIHRDDDRDGIPDRLGEYVARINSSLIERGKVGVPAQPVVLRWATLGEIVADCGLSRRYAGVHFREGDLRARELGGIVGRQAAVLALSHVDRGTTDSGQRAGR